MTIVDAIEKLQALLDISKSAKYGYPMDFSDERMLEEVIAFLSESDYRRDPVNQPENIR